MEDGGLGYVLSLACPSTERAMVERSRGKELLVDDNLSDKRTDSPGALFLQRIFVEHGPRVRQIHLSGITTGMMAALFEHLPPTSLQLRSLELGYSLGNGRPAFPTEVLRTETLRTLRVQRHGIYCPFQT